ncbi:NAD(P)-dependent oxidoreductase [Subtercola endophyticus]|uniref:NAD(P)-dependent oxidoreductase n=1 Tax=Subtercola endophyticus TaxID=2895559 RepID=UPI001E352AD1|nr:SDR family oxidoreductase [Subtercola endophyticus]UFS59632.1 SDR family oxidoreductase [Subtercola endophyticus]
MLTTVYPAAYSFKEQKTMRIIVFGSNGPTGRLVVRDAVAAGHAVTAFTRHPAGFSVPGLRLPDARVAVVEGDVYDVAAVERAVADHDVVISTLGVPFGKAPITVYSAGIEAILRAMHAAAVKRLICVSSSAVDPSAGAHGGWFFEKVLQGYLVTVMGKTLYADMRRMEQVVQASDVDFTIVRPSGLFETPQATDYAVAENFVKSKFTSRADLAASLLAQASDPTFVRKVMAVGTVQVQPSMLQLLWREGIRKPRPSVA